MTPRVRFTPFLAAGMFAVGTLASTPRPALADAPFGPQTVISSAAISAESVYATDVDGDGDIDVLSASRNDLKVAWYENDGAQNFTLHTITTTATGALDVYATDVDSDGDVDVDVLSAMAASRGTRRSGQPRWVHSPHLSCRTWR